MIQLAAGAMIEWPGCPACAGWPPCPTWIVATAQLGYPVFSCQPYPCQCRWIETRPCKGSKWCPCSGRPPAQHLPANCCANRLDNPAVVRVGTASEALDDPGGYANSPEALQVRGRPSETRRLAVLEPVPAARVRLFDPAEITCECPTPWDGLKTPPGGLHCTDCHRNYKSVTVFSAHRRWVTQPCRDLAGIVDGHTGRRLFRVTMDTTGLPVWSFA